MENEKRLIDALPFMKAGWHLVRTGKSNEYLASLSLADVPTVDAVEVVRCKDCKWPYRDEYSGCYFCHERQVGSEHFCSYGERKDNGQGKNVRDEQNLHPQFKS